MPATARGGVGGFAFGAHEGRAAEGDCDHIDNAGVLADRDDR
jgi:hypothetical protein